MFFWQSKYTDPLTPHWGVNGSVRDPQLLPVRSLPPLAPLSCTFLFLVLSDIYPKAWQGRIHNIDRFESFSLKYTKLSLSSSSNSKTSLSNSKLNFGFTAKYFWLTVNMKGLTIVLAVLRSRGRPFWSEPEPKQLHFFRLRLQKVSYKSILSHSEQHY